MLFTVSSFKKQIDVLPLLYGGLQTKHGLYPVALASSEVLKDIRFAGLICSTSDVTDNDTHLNEYCRQIGLVNQYQFYCE